MPATVPVYRRMRFLYHLISRRQEEDQKKADLLFILFQKENAEGVEEKEQDDIGDQKGDGHGNKRN